MFEDGNTFGEQFKITTFGESHGPAIGCLIQGCPAGLTITPQMIQDALDKRKPGNNSPLVSKRQEPDKIEILSGIYNDKTEGTPIALLIRNINQNSIDYKALENLFRPGHADFTYEAKYHGFQDKRGGGRSSGRETASRVAGGALALELLKSQGIKITAYTIKAAGISITKKDLSEIKQNNLRAPDNEAAEKMQKKIEELKSKGDSAGGIIECIIEGCPAGIGEPVFDKLDAELAKAIMSIGAIKGIEFGDGFLSADSTGSTNNDCMTTKDGKITFDSNHCGGILGGISNGNTIIFRAAVKPVPSITKEQNTVVKKADGTFENTQISIQGRHDTCLCPRIVPVIEAMTAITLANFIKFKE